MTVRDNGFARRKAGPDDHFVAGRPAYFRRPDVSNRVFHAIFDMRFDPGS
jgi:hypothetical protein